MRLAHQPLQPADIHVPLVLVPLTLRGQLLRSRSMDLTHVAARTTPLRQPASQHASLLSNAQRDHERGAQTTTIVFRQLATSCQARFARGQATKAQVHRRVSQVRRRVHIAHDRHANVRDCGHRVVA